ncbi:polygalacturonase QRT3-like [Iris pallida]|uniref:Polygalacturonase QRT3-like n=1 Tax=Iris pallida TaxID=29817 RepID=A0AAX6G0L5_IRIPA|nr:polygalacturonase QRT3-like [Iris pallida]
MEKRGNNGGFFRHLFFPTTAANIILPLLALFFFLVSSGEADGYRGGTQLDQAHRHRDHLIRRTSRMMAGADADGSTPSPSPSPFPSPSPSPSPQISRPGSRVFHVTDYGADPTGKVDSTAAIAKAISAAFAATLSDRQLIAGVADLGGAEVHLDGGAYLVSSPVTLPSQGGGNLKIHSGSLRASGDFPTNRYVIELWSSPSSAAASSEARQLNASELLSTSGYDYEYVTLRDLLLDSNFRGGGVAVVNSLRTTIDNCYVVRFVSDGVWVRGGHETMIRGCYLGQHITAGGDPGERRFTGVGINLMGNDNAVTDTVIFSADTGILVSGQANTFSGVHCYNKATGFGGTGIYLRLPGNTQTRIVNCYMDYNSIVAEDPVQLVVSGSFFLGDGNVVLKSVKGVARDVSIVDNIFSGSGKGVPNVALDETGGARFADVDAVVVERNGVSGMARRSTSGRGVARGEGATVWSVDFSSVLLFPDRIDHVQYTLLPESGFPNHVLRNVSANQVVVETDVPVKATVHVTVYQMGQLS